MGQIKKLAENVIDKIKAGEVVERPLNVVKELVENAIDAGATQVTVELIDGGKKLIQVIDNGSGILPDDLPRALERHATSKIECFSDLEEVSSFGFRGEALASIAAVSAFSLRSRTADCEVGTEVSLSPALELQMRSVVMPVGTSVSVKDLFSSTPARLKFLKATATEFAHIYDFMVSLAFAYPHISLKLVHNGRDSFAVTPACDIQERFSQIVEMGGEEFTPVDFERGSFRVSGFVGLPEYAKAVPKYFVTFVNGRLVKDRVVRSAVVQGYAGLLLKGLAPSAILFVTADPKWVDVNAHPAKTEVRFHDALVVQDLIAQAVQDAVKKNVHKRVAGATAEPQSDVSRSFVGAPVSRVNATLATQVVRGEAQRVSAPSAPRVFAAPEVRETFSRVVPAVTLNEPLLFEAETQQNVFSNATYLGQYLCCYLLFEVSQELWVVDQHAFHERILFEELMRDFKKERRALQSLLVPVRVPLPAPLVQVVMGAASICGDLGFEVRPSSDGSGVDVMSMPSFLPQEKIASSFEEILVRIFALENVPGSDHPITQRAQATRLNVEGLSLRHEGLQAEQVYHLFFATVACHAAVRSGESLNAELVRRLMGRAGDVDFYAHCPHGRPVLRKFNEMDVAQWFLRT